MISTDPPRAAGRYSLLPHALIEDPARTRTDLTVYWALVRHVDGAGVCYPSIRRLAALAHCAPRTVHRALAVLEEAGWITRSSGRMAGSVTTYQVHRIRAERGGGGYDTHVTGGYDTHVTGGMTPVADGSIPKGSIPKERKTDTPHAHARAREGGAAVPSARDILRRAILRESADAADVLDGALRGARVPAALAACLRGLGPGGIHESGTWNDVAQAILAVASKPHGMLTERAVLHETVRQRRRREGGEETWIPTPRGRATRAIAGEPPDSIYDPRIPGSAAMEAARQLRLEEAAAAAPPEVA